MNLQTGTCFVCLMTLAADTMLVIKSFSTNTHKHNSFVLIASGILESVAKLHLDWCIAIPLSGMTFGGWVSENYIALARLFCWFFSKLPSLQQGPEYKDPTRPFTTWTIKEICEWNESKIKVLNGILKVAIF